MSAGAVFKFHGRFGSLNEIKAHIHAGAEYPPQIGDSAQYVEADGSLAEASFTSTGWMERSRFNPDGSTSFAGPLEAKSFSASTASKGVWGWKIIGGTNFANAADNQGGATVSTSRRVYRNEGAGAITRIAFVYANAVPNGTSVSERDLTGLGDITVSSYLETADGTLQLSFAGAATALLSAGRTIVSDPIDTYIAPAERFWARSVATKLTAVKIPVTGLNYQSYEGRSIVADVGSGTGMTGLTGSTGDGAFTPVAIIGWTNGDYIEWVGDSITRGVSDSAGPLVPTGLQGVVGWPRRWLYGKCHYLVAGYAGGQLAQWSNPINAPTTRGWLARLAPPTTVVLAFGANDLMSNPTTAAMQTVFARAVAEARARGVYKVGVAEILPRTITSDGWVTQQPAVAAFAAGGVRDQLNAWFRSSGLFDFVLPTNTAVATGAEWTLPPAAGADTADGCHPLTAGSVKIAASMPDPASLFA